MTNEKKNTSFGKSIENQNECSRDKQTTLTQQVLLVDRTLLIVL